MTWFDDIKTPAAKLMASNTYGKINAPSAHERCFIPYPMGLDKDFETCLPDTLKQEGGYSNAAHDPGGMTMEGIIQREYDAKRRQWGLPTQWVDKISTDEMRTIYYTDYWLDECVLLPLPLALEVFDFKVNAGKHPAISGIQIALEFSIDDIDGDFGPKTLAAVKALTETQLDVVIKRYCVARASYYDRLQGFKYFGKDWIRRDDQITAEARALEPAESPALTKALDEFVADKPPDIMGKEK
jgi:lysozyme family protein